MTTPALARAVAAIEPRVFLLVDPADLLAVCACVRACVRVRTCAWFCMRARVRCSGRRSCMAGALLNMPLELERARL
jgi:hypothetical protein